MNKTILTIFSLGVFLAFVVGNVSAALPPPSADFKISWDDLNLEEGYWYFSFVGLGSYNEKDVNSATDYFNKMKEEYIQIKKICGSSDSFLIEHKFSDYKGNPKFPEGVPYSETNAVKPECEQYLNYVWGWVPPNTIETQDTYVLHSINFKEFMYSYYNKIDDSYRFNSYRNVCKLEGNSCNLNFISEETAKNGGPYFVVLEKVNSTNEIYFSELINIPYESVENVKWEQFPQEENYPLRLKQIELGDNHKLLIHFENAESEIIKEPSHTPNLIYWFIGFAVLVIIIILFLSLKKKK